MDTKAGEVRLENHSPRWQRMFAQELDELWGYFGDTAIRISHIGSTAIDGIEAKPIIDIAVAVNDLKDFDLVSHNFTSDPNYSIKKDFANDEILIRKGGKQKREYYIHVMDIDSKRYKDVIFFRNLLLHDERIRNNYRDLKHVIAKKYSHDRKKYSSSKKEFIQSILEMEWSRTALVPAAIIAGVSLFVFLVSLYARLTIPLGAMVFGFYVVAICRVGLLFGGAAFVSTAISSGILICRFFKAKKINDTVVAKIQKEIAKEARSRK